MLRLIVPNILGGEETGWAFGEGGTPWVSWGVLQCGMQLTSLVQSERPQGPTE